MPECLGSVMKIDTEFEWLKNGCMCLEFVCGASISMVT